MELDRSYSKDESSGICVCKERLPVMKRNEDKAKEAY